MPPFTRVPIKFAMGGIAAGRPPDLIPPDQYRDLVNVRSYQDGRIEPRPGLTHIGTAAASININSIIRLSDYDPAGSSAYVVGRSTAVYVNFVAVGGLVTSGLPLSFVIFQPDQSAVPWIYIGDDTGFRKIDPSSTLHWIGVLSPNYALPAITEPGAGPFTTGEVYSYRLVGRVTTTGAKSHPGPAFSRTIVGAAANMRFTTPAATASTDTDVWDIYRFGGPLSSWRYVGSSTVSTIFTDDLPAVEIASNETLSFNDYAPFLSIGASASGNCTVAADIVTATVGTFNTNWVPGTTISIAGQAYITAARPTSTTSVRITETGAPAGPTGWRVDAPLLEGQACPYMWGPWGGGQQGAVMFGCGDDQMPGFLKWTNGNDPDSQGLANSLEITGPSEPLMHGCIYDGRSYAWSSERMFAIYPSSSTNNQFVAQVVPNSKGLFAPWAFAVGPRLWFLARDGIYETTGGEPVSITDADLQPLFRHESQPGVALEGIAPPNFALADQLRLAYSNGYLYFDYDDTGGLATTLVYNTRTKAWSRDSYNPATTFNNRTTHYADQGIGSMITVDREAFDKTVVACGFGLYELTGVADDTNAIAGSVKTGYQTTEDTRSNKLLSEVMLDLDPQGATVTAVVKANLGALANVVTVTPSDANRVKTIANVNSGLGTLVRNMALELSWSSSTVAPKLYEWQPAYVPKPEDTTIRATDWSDDGLTGAKYLRGCVIEANTYNVAKTVEVQRDGGTVVATLTITHNGQLEQPYAFTPTAAHEMRLNPTDADSWQLFNVQWIWDEWPENSVIQEDFSDGGFPGEKYVRGLIVEADTSGGAVSFQVQRDGGTVAATPSLTTTGRDKAPFEFDPPFLAHTLRCVPLAAWRKFSAKWIYDEYPELARIYSSWDDAGKPGPKYVRGVTIEADTENAARDVQVQQDGGTVAATLSCTHNGQTQVTYDFATPFVAYMIRLVPQANWRFFKVVWIADPWPDLDNIITAWEDAGHKGAKHVRGVVLDADTAAASISVQVETDEETLASTITGVDHAARGQIAYPFTTPFICHLLRLKPQANWRYWGAQWLFDPWPENEQITSAWENADYPGDKHVRGLVLVADTTNAAVTINIESDRAAIAASITATHDGRESISYDFPTPFLAHDLRLVPQGDMRIFEQHWIFDKYPELDAIISEWTEAGTPNAKYVQGMRLIADTGNVAVPLEIEYDGGTTGANVTATHNGKVSIAYSWTPFVAHTLRLVPTGSIRIFEPPHWIFEPIPDAATRWQTQPTTHDQPGYQHIRDAYIAHESSSNITLTVTVDGTAQTPLTISHGSGVYAKTYVRVPVYKGKSFEYLFTSPVAFRVYQRDCEVRVKAWGSTEPYSIVNPFGDMSRERGATI